LLAIEKTFGSFDEFKKKFEEIALGRFGSGWAWLSADVDENLVAHSTPNQDAPCMEEKSPIIGLDVWEHAYYLKYQNRRAEYVQALWNVVDWNVAERNYSKLTKHS